MSISGTQHWCQLFPFSFIQSLILLYHCARVPAGWFGNCSHRRLEPELQPVCPAGKEWERTVACWIRFGFATDHQFGKSCGVVPGWMHCCWLNPCYCLRHFSLPVCRTPTPRPANLTFVLLLIPDLCCFAQIPHKVHTRDGWSNVFWRII